MDTLPVRTQAHLLGISRTHLYYQSMPPSAREVAIKHRIDALFTTVAGFSAEKCLIRRG